MTAPLADPRRAAQVRDGSEELRMVVKQCLPPVVGPAVRLLVLGSLPGEQSLAAGRYYANPQNQFWRLIGAVIGRDLPVMAYEDRLAALLQAGVGLWDVVASASRTGSLDARIRGHRPNKLAELIATLPVLAAIGFNGRTAAAIGSRELASGTGLAMISLPSSSAAYTLAFAEKRRRWLELRKFTLH
jgi:hypoxanthine-DNA glycosylase